MILKTKQTYGLDQITGKRSNIHIWELVVSVAKNGKDLHRGKFVPKTNNLHMWQSVFVKEQKETKLPYEDVLFWLKSIKQQLGALNSSFRILSKQHFVHFSYFRTHTTVTYIYLMTLLFPRSS